MTWKRSSKLELDLNTGIIKRDFSKTARCGRRKRSNSSSPLLEMVIPCNFPDSTCNSTRSTPHDVHFIVGPEGDTWTLSARRQTLARKEGLAVILRDAGSTIRITDVDKRGFEHLLRHIEGCEPNFTSLSTARSTLDVACKYQNDSLVELCIKYLDLQLDVTNVLTVYKKLSKYCSNAHTNAPCAPIYNATTPNETAIRIQNLCSDLLHNCLVMIDDNAIEVITREEFECLDKDDMMTIVSRNSLQINDELILFDCIVRWLKCECRKLGKSVNPDTRVELLGDLIFKVRFGLMSRTEFLNAPAKVGVLTVNEVNEILATIDHPTTSITDQICSIKRTANKEKPKPLSGRTESNQKIKEKKDKSKALLNCLTVWTVLFD